MRVEQGGRWEWGQLRMGGMKEEVQSRWACATGCRGESIARVQVSYYQTSFSFWCAQDAKRHCSKVIEPEREMSDRQKRRREIDG